MVELGFTLHHDLTLKAAHTIVLEHCLLQHIPFLLLGDQGVEYNFDFFEF